MEVTPLPTGQFVTNYLPFADKHHAARKPTPGVDCLRPRVQLRDRNPNGRILVSCDIENERTIAGGIECCERRPVTAAYFADLHTPEVQQREAVGMASVLANQIAKLRERQVGGVEFFDIDRKLAQYRAELIERHAFLRYPSSVGHLRINAAEEVFL